jgi:hypothetical protein
MNENSSPNADGRACADCGETIACQHTFVLMEESQKGPDFPPNNIGHLCTKCGGILITPIMEQII